MNICILLAGGKGSRFGENIPKQFYEVNHKPIIIYTIEEILKNNYIDKIIIPCIKEYQEYLLNLLSKYDLKGRIEVIEGGINGLESVRNALNFLRHCKSDDVILIYESVRPLVNNDIFLQNIKICKKYGNSVTVKKLYETPLKSINAIFSDEYINRDEFFLLMQPQTFFYGDLFEMFKHMKPYMINEKLSCTALLALDKGMKLYFVEDNRDNFKITTKEDIRRFKFYLESNS